MVVMSNVALVQKAVGVSLGAGKKFMRDQNTSEAFLAVFDFKSSFVKKDWDGTHNTSFNNLIDNGGVADPASSMNSNEFGIIKDSSSSYVFLPDSFKLGAGEREIANSHFMFYMWVTPTPNHTYTANAIPTFGGYAFQTGSAAFYSIYFLCDGAGKPNEIRFNFMGQRFSSTDSEILNIFTDGKPHLLALEMEAFSTTSYKRRAYLDGQLLHESDEISFTEGAILPNPQDSNSSEKPAIGINQGYSTEFRGTFHKVGVVDWKAFSDETRTGLEIIQDEWSLYSQRFL